MLVLVFFKDQVMLLSCGVQDRKGMSASQGKSCATSHIHMQIAKSKNVLRTQNKKAALVMHSTSTKCSVEISQDTFYLAKKEES